MIKIIPVVLVVLVALGVFFLFDAENSKGFIGELFDSSTVKIPSPCSISHPLDLVILVDTCDAVTADVNGYYKIKILKNLVKNIVLNLEGKDVDIGIITWGEYPTTVVPIGNLSKSDIVSEIRASLKPNPGRSTIGLGLGAAFHMAINHRRENNNKVILILVEGNPTLPLSYTSPMTGKTYEAPTCSGGGDNPIDTAHQHMHERMLQIKYSGISTVVVDLGREFNPDHHTLDIMSMKNPDNVVSLVSGLEYMDTDPDMIKEATQLIMDKLCAVASVPKEEGCPNADVKEWYPW